jgi:hypothetical protein
VHACANGNAIVELCLLVHVPVCAHMYIYVCVQHIILSICSILCFTIDGVYSLNRGSKHSIYITIIRHEIIRLTSSALCTYNCERHEQLPDTFVSLLPVSS